ncbi:MAG: pyridoxal-phosphate dependent enzyme [Pseudomonadota bacterium]
MTYTDLLDHRKPLAFHKASSNYQATPLKRVSLAGRDILVKDETARMGLGAFKAVGGIYAVAQLIAGAMGRSLAGEQFRSQSVRDKAATMTFVCASAGNHGMAVAAGAQLFGARSRIHLADTVPEAFARRLRDKGAEVVRSGATYEDSIAAAIHDTETTGALHLADGSWPDYTEPPRLVMEGYTVIADEMRSQLSDFGKWPSQVYLQAGVGGMAAAIALMIRKNWPQQPEIIVVEPEAAPCLRESVQAGKMVTVEGPVSNMGRLDCKTPSMLALEVLEQAADRFVTVSDESSENTVEIAREAGLHSTPSGVAGLTACLSEDSGGIPLVVISEGNVSDN